MLAEKRVVARHVLGRDRQHLRADVLELGETVVVAVELLGAHGRVVTRVEDEDHGLPRVLRERVLASTRPRQGEVRGSIADADAHPTCSIRDSAMSKLL